MLYESINISFGTVCMLVLKFVYLHIYVHNYTGIAFKQNEFMCLENHVYIIIIRLSVRTYVYVVFANIRTYIVIKFVRTYI